MSDKNSKASNDRNNNETVEEKVVKEERKIKPEILETLLPTTISYNSTCLPDAIFLTTSNGQLITTSTINYNTFLAGLNLPTTSTKHEESKAAALKPSASDNKSSAQNSTNSTSSSTTNIISSTSTQQLFKFPFLTSLQGGLAPFAPISTFGLPNTLIAPNLTFPLYNSLLTVTTAAKEQTPDAKKATDSSTKASKSSSKKGSMTTSRGRKRTAQSRLPAKLKEPAAVARRNARERRRVKMVNDGFLRLRRHVPTDPKNKKLSKVKTLRLAIEYIHHLQDLLQSDAPNLQISIPQMTTTFDDDDDGDTTWLNTDSVNRLEMDEEIFQTIDPARLRTNYNEFIDR